MDEPRKYVDPPLTPAQVNALHKFYHTDQNYRGRDTIYYHFRGQSNPNLRMSKGQIMGWLRRQDMWQRSQRPRRDKAISAVLSGKPGKVFQVDLIDFSNRPSRGYHYIMVLIDTFSRRMWVETMRTKTDRESKQALQKMWARVAAWFRQKGKTFEPRVLSSDNGGEFMGEFHEYATTELGLRHVYGIAGRPQSNGLVERSNQSLKYLLLRAMRASPVHLYWTDEVRVAVDKYNALWHRSIGMTPNAAAALDPDGIDQLDKRLRRRAKSQKRTPRPLLNVGDAVRLRINKSRLQKMAVENFSKDVWEIVDRRLHRDVRGAEQLHPVHTYTIRLLGDTPDGAVYSGFPAERLLRIGRAEDGVAALVQNKYTPWFESKKELGKRKREMRIDCMKDDGKTVEDCDAEWTAYLEGVKHMEITHAIVAANRVISKNPRLPRATVDDVAGNGQVSTRELIKKRAPVATRTRKRKYEKRTTP